MSRQPSAVFLLAAMCLLASGCNLGPFYGSAYFMQKGSDRPLGPDGRETSVSGYASWDFVKTYGDVGWKTSQGRISPDHIIEKIEKFSPRPEPQTVEGDFGRYKVAHLYPDRRTIVCTDPVVVVVTLQETLVPGRLDGWSETGSSALFVKFALVDFVLPAGYIGDTSIPKASEAWWFSPTLDQPLTPIDLTSKPPRIPLGIHEGVERSLILAQRRSGWRVRMKRSKAPNLPPAVPSLTAALPLNVD
jgi:hypothetical protein